MGHVSHAIYTCLKYWSIIALSVFAFFSCFSLRCFSRKECFLGAKRIFHNPVKTLFSMLPFSLAGVAWISLSNIWRKTSGKWLAVHNVY